MYFVYPWLTGGTTRFRWQPGFAESRTWHGPLRPEATATNRQCGGRRRDSP